MFVYSSCQPSYSPGCREPNVPEDVKVLETYSDSVVIQWRVSFITYTPEIYVVKYGTNIESLPFFGEYLSSGSDIGAVNEIYSVQLKGLSPGTKYCFVVAVNNSYHSSKTVPSCFLTKETGDIQS